MYQDTVFADVPATSAVAVSNGGPATRCGVPLKKLSAAATAEAAVSAVLASSPTAAVSAVCKLVAVAAAVRSIVNSFGPGVTDCVAVSVIVSLLPSGKSTRNWIVSPAFGNPVRSTVIAGGEPAGPVAVELASAELMQAQLKPNAEGTTSSARLTEVAVGAEIDHAAKPAGAQIRLPALVDDLFETCTRAVAVHDLLEAGHGRLIGRPPGKDVAVANLGIQQTEYLAQARHRLCSARWSSRCFRCRCSGMPWP